MAKGTDEQPCIGGDYCGRTTNGWFVGGSHGPGYYCGWCEAVPDAAPVARFEARESITPNCWVVVLVEDDGRPLSHGPFVTFWPPYPDPWWAARAEAERLNARGVPRGTEGR